MGCVMFLLTFGVAPDTAADTARFPWTAVECERRHQIALGHITAIETICPCWVDNDWIIEAKWRMACWSYLSMAKGGSAYSLGELRSLIGDRNCQLGIMPDYLPTTRFVPHEGAP